MKFLHLMCVISGLVVPSLALDREAFTFTNYDLNVRVEPDQQRLGVRGRVTLRNDSTTPQKAVALQISSTLDWKAIQIGGTAVQFVTHEYTSDIDHTGALSEVIVTLPREVPSKGTIVLDVGYEGLIPLDVTRLARIGVPEDKAKHTDWDQIGKSFTAVRGIGYVAWYPVAMESANLSDGNSVDETVGRWKTREAEAVLKIKLTDSGEVFSESPVLLSNGKGGKQFFDKMGKAYSAQSEYSFEPLGLAVPTFVIANYQKVAPNDLLAVHYLSGQEGTAKEYAEVAANIDPILAAGGGSGSLQILALPDADAASFVSEGMLLCPLKSPITNEAVLDIVYGKASHLVSSPRAWVQDGLGHYAQAAFIADQTGRQAALDYLTAHRAPLVEAEKAKPHAADWETAHSLINAPDDLYLQAKAMDVWWMLNDMLENPPLGVLLNYHATEDKDGNYMQRVIEKQTQRDLQWFFDDWVYRDRGLPDFRVDSVYARPIVDGGFMVTVSIENLGDAGAEVPVILRTESGEIIKRLEVRAKSKAAFRVQVASTPQEVVVNDGSVPESDVSNNVFQVPPPDAGK